MARSSNKLMPAILVAAGVTIAAGIGPYAAAGGTGDGKVTPVASEALANLPGQRLTAVVVEYEPGGKSEAHRHAGSVFAYVLEGAVRSAINDEPARIYRAGESFFEPPGSRHAALLMALERHRGRSPAPFAVAR